MSNSKASSACSSDTDGDVCWVCLSDDKQGESLEKPCACPRYVHRACLSRWQLQSAGKSEENTCRFCKAALPDWREGVTPQGLRPASPIMSIHHNGETYMVKVAPGPDGLRQFQEAVRTLLNLEDDQDFDISFECRVPGAATSTPKMELKGMNAYDAAVYCASITAAERLQQEKSAAAVNTVHPDPMAPARHTVAAASQLQSTQSYPCISPTTSPTPDPRVVPSLDSRPRAGSQPLVPLPVTPTSHTPSRRAAAVLPSSTTLTPRSITALRAPTTSSNPSTTLPQDCLQAPTTHQGLPRALEPNASLGCTLRRRVVSPDSSPSSSSPITSDDEQSKDAHPSGSMVLPSADNPFTNNIRPPGMAPISTTMAHMLDRPSSNAASGSGMATRSRFASDSTRPSNSPRAALDAGTSLAQARHSTSISSSMRGITRNSPREQQANRERRATSAYADSPSMDYIMSNPPPPPQTTPKTTPRTTVEQTGTELTCAFAAMSTFASSPQAPCGATPSAAMSAFASMQQFMADEDLLGSFPAFDPATPSPAPGTLPPTSSTSHPPLLATAGSSRSLRSATLSGTHSLTPPQPLPLPSPSALFPMHSSGSKLRPPHHLQSHTSDTSTGPCHGTVPRSVVRQEALVSGWQGSGRPGRYAGAAPGSAAGADSYAQKAARREHC